MRFNLPAFEIGGELGEGPRAKACRQVSSRAPFERGDCAVFCQPLVNGAETGSLTRRGFVTAQRFYCRFGPALPPSLVVSRSGGKRPIHHRSPHNLGMRMRCHIRRIFQPAWTFSRLGPWHKEPPAIPGHRSKVNASSGDAAVRRTRQSGT